VRELGIEDTVFFEQSIPAAVTSARFLQVSGGQYLLP